MTFDHFYQQYPRKVSRKFAEKSWLRLSLEEQERAIAALPQHVAYWAATNRGKEYIPYPASWLNAGSFDDEIEIPAPKKPAIQAGWWASEAATAVMGASLGLSPRGGETWNQFRDRIKLKLQEEAA